MTGSSIFDYVHQSDHVELAEQLGVTLAHHQRIAAVNPNGTGDLDAKGAIGSLPSIPDGEEKAGSEVGPGRVMINDMYYFSLLPGDFLDECSRGQNVRKDRLRPSLLHQDEVHADKEGVSLQVIRIQSRPTRTD